MKKALSVALVAALVLGLSAIANPAEAGGWRRHYHRGGSVFLAAAACLTGAVLFDAVLAPRTTVVYAAPPPVAYAPTVYAPPVAYAPPVVCAPPPVVYPQPVVVYPRPVVVAPHVVYRHAHWPAPVWLPAPCSPRVHVTGGIWYGR